ncbi:MAG: glycosyltransferase [Fibromonadaceae bacterium]|jgi:alpha-1,3-rhamnosyltransferase|nr:glycosyltransferase [Fibromonadaceae bacterium]
MVSVLMPSYNHAPFVEEAVRSAMGQKGVDFELLVIDDGSTDESPKILKNLSEELGFYFLSRENRGLIPTLNELAGMAKGKYICTLASDDIMPLGRLEIQVRYMEEHPEVPACFGQIKKISPNGKLEEKLDHRFLRGVPSVSFEELFLTKKEVHGCTELIRKTAFDCVGGYNQKFKIEDYPMWLALSNKFGNLSVLPDVFCYYRILPNDKNMHRNLTFTFTQALDVVKEYEGNKFYKKAVDNWNACWFSFLAYSNKKEAFLKLPKLCSFSWRFIYRLPKIFIPKFFLKY